MSALRTLVLGGARSGKSVYAEKLVENCGKNKVYIATGQALDDEMSQRISQHQDRRGADWLTVETSVDVCGAFQNLQAGNVVLLDCVTLWVSNLMATETAVEAEVRKFCKLISEFDGELVIVSNEVGLGIVPENALARRFRDEAGLANQMIADVCNQVVFVAAGQAMVMKDER